MVLCRKCPRLAHIERAVEKRGWSLDAFNQENCGFVRRLGSKKTSGDPHEKWLPNSTASSHRQRATIRAKTTAWIMPRMLPVDEFRQKGAHHLAPTDTVGDTSDKSVLSCSLQSCYHRVTGRRVSSGMRVNLQWVFLVVDQSTLCVFSSDFVPPS